MFFLKKLRHLRTLLRCFHQFHILLDHIRSGQTPDFTGLAEELYSVLVPTRFKAPVGTVQKQEFVFALDNVFKLFLR